MNRTTLKIVVLLLFAHSAFAGGDPTAANKITEPRADAATVVVSQGDVSVTQGDIDIWMLEVPEADRAGFIRSPERIEQTLQQMLLIKHLVRDARAAGLDKDPLVEAHMALAAERTLARYQREKVARAIVTPDLKLLAAERYQANPDVFREPERADVVHLLITEQQHSPTEAKQIIERLYRKAAKNPQGLESLAAEKSEDPSAQSNRGRLQGFKLSDLDKDFVAALRQLQPGEISEPVKTQFGWHLIRLDRLIPGRLPPYEEVEAGLIAKLEQEYQLAALRKYTDDLRQQPMQPNPDALGKLPFRYGGEDPLLTPAE
ncbi:MAG: peptidylprolyl isomerase [Lysobacterales bacterium]